MAEKKKTEKMLKITKETGMVMMRPMGFYTKEQIAKKMRRGYWKKNEEVNA